MSGKARLSGKTSTESGRSAATPGLFLAPLASDIFGSGGLSARMMAMSLSSPRKTVKRSH